MGRNVVGYVRVSTRRQAKHEISLDEQERQIRAHAALRGQAVVDVYVEKGASGRNDRRPALQQLMEDARRPGRRFEAVLIWNFSRFFRDDFDFERYRRELDSVGVRLDSVTQQIAEGPAGNLTRRVTTVVDAYQSEVNAENVKMAMAANAARGYWNGSIPPFGYRTETVARLDKKDKKKLVIEEAEADIVRLIFDLYLERCGNVGKSGVIAITSELNRQHMTIRGKPFRTGTVHEILRRSTYSGVHYYNQTDSRTRRERPKDQWVPLEVPAIVSEDDFERVQAKLAKNHPKVTPARTVASPTLTAGLSKCGAPGCGSGMILSTGKGGQYRYLMCDKKRTMSADACTSRRVPMAMVDDIVLGVLEEKVLAPARLKALLGAILSRTDEAVNERRKRLKARKTEKTECEGQKSRVIKLVATGALQPSDPQLVDMIKGLDARLAAIAVEIRSLEKQLAQPSRSMTDDLLARFSRLVRGGLRSKDPQFRRAYLRLIVDEIIINEDEVLVRGSREALEHAVFLGTDARDGVLTSIQDWRTRQDSNLWPLPSEGSALSS